MNRPLAKLLAFAVVLLLIQATPSASFGQSDLAIQMQLTKTTVLLGEPDWVEVVVTNLSDNLLSLDMGSDCFGTKPLKIEIPEAEQWDSAPLPCYGGIAGSCPSGGPPALEPGKTLTRRYVLTGNFRIAKPGGYTVRLEKLIRYEQGPPQLGGQMTQEQTASAEMTLTALPADPVKLLSIEQDLAPQATARVTTPPFPVPANGQPYDVEALRRYEDERREIELEQLETRDSIVEGLAAYPAAGMEQTFEDWMVSGNTYGLAALLKLNTPDARRLIAKAADPSQELIARWRQHIRVAPTLDVEAVTQSELANWRQQAVIALGKTGDRSYLPLLEKLAEDPNPDVQSAAISNLGPLGGDQELPFLTLLVNSDVDSFAAIQSMGQTASSRAVPVLIGLFDTRHASQNDLDFSLSQLTHHQVPAADTLTPLEDQRAWQDWWVRNHATTRIFGPFEDCSVTQ
jgi:HEAT repeats